MILLSPCLFFVFVPVYISVVVYIRADFAVGPWLLSTARISIQNRISIYQVS
jgi:hypothetical protein